MMTVISGTVTSGIFSIVDKVSDFKAFSVLQSASKIDHTAVFVYILLGK